METPPSVELIDLSSRFFVDVRLCASEALLICVL